MLAPTHVLYIFGVVRCTPHRCINIDLNVYDIAIVKKRKTIHERFSSRNEQSLFHLPSKFTATPDRDEP